jgi:hypothetical protein
MIIRSSRYIFCSLGRLADVLQGVSSKRGGGNDRDLRDWSDTRSRTGRKYKEVLLEDLVAYRWVGE